MTRKKCIQCIRDKKMSDFNIEKDDLFCLILSYSHDYENSRKVKQGFSCLFTLCKSTKFGLLHLAAEFSKSSPEHASTDRFF